MSVVNVTTLPYCTVKEPQKKGNECDGCTVAMVTIKYGEG